MTDTDWAKYFFGVLKKLVRETRKQKPETRLYLCHFFYELLQDCLHRAELKPEDIGSSETELRVLNEGIAPKVAKPRRRKK